MGCRFIGLQQANIVRRDHIRIITRQVVHCVAGVAGLATGLAGPGNTLAQILASCSVADKRIGGTVLGEIVADLRHVAVAVLTAHAAVVHGTAQTLGVFARMTGVAGLLEDVILDDLIGIGRIRINAMS